MKIACFEHTGRWMEEGSHRYRGITFDTNTGEILTLDHLGEIKEDVYRYLLEYLEKNYSMYTGWELLPGYAEIVRNCLEEETIWSFTDDGIGFWFGDGVLGKWEFSVVIPCRELSGLKEKYRKEDCVVAITDEPRKLFFGEKEYLASSDREGIYLDRERIDLQTTIVGSRYYYVSFGRETYLLTGNSDQNLNKSEGSIFFYRWNGVEAELVDEWCGYLIREVEDAHYIRIVDFEGREYLCEISKKGIRRIAEM